MKVFKLLILKFNIKSTSVYKILKIWIWEAFYPTSSEKYGEVTKYEFCYLRENSEQKELSKNPKNLTSSKQQLRIFDIIKFSASIAVIFRFLCHILWLRIRCENLDFTSGDFMFQFMIMLLRIKIWRYLWKGLDLNLYFVRGIL